MGKDLVALVVVAQDRQSRASAALAARIRPLAAFVGQGVVVGDRQGCCAHRHSPPAPWPGRYLTGNIAPIDRIFKPRPRRPAPALGWGSGSASDWVSAGGRRGVQRQAEARAPRLGLHQRVLVARPHPHLDRLVGAHGQQALAPTGIADRRKLGALGQVPDHLAGHILRVQRLLAPHQRAQGLDEDAIIQRARCLRLAQRQPQRGQLRHRQGAVPRRCPGPGCR